MMKTRTVLFLLFLTCACKPSLDNSLWPKRIMIENNKITNVNEHNPFSSIKLITIKSEGKHYLGSFKKIIEFDKRLFIFDNKSMTGNKIFVIDFDGNVINILDKTGKGPGEYVSLTDMDIDGKTGNVFVVDQMKPAILEYDNNFNYIRSIKPSVKVPIDLISYNEETKSFIVVKENGRLIPDFNYHMYQMDRNGTVLQKHFPYDEIFGVFLGSPMRMWPVKEAVDYLPGYSNSIFRLSNDTCFEAFNFVFEYPTLTHTDYTATRETNLGINNQSFIESEGFIIFRWIYQHHSYFSVYDKAQDQVQTFNNPSNPTCNCGSTYRFVNFIDENKAIMIADNTNISYILFQIDADGKRVVNPEAIKDLSKSDELNEQILIIAEICLQ